MYILLVEDDDVDQIAFERVIKPFGHKYKIVSLIEEAKRLISTEKFDLIVSDYHLPDGFGSELLQLSSHPPIIITTGTGKEEVAVKAMKLGAADYLIKDMNRTYLTLLPSIIDQIVERAKTNHLLKIFGRTIEVTHDAIYIIDKEGKIIFVNEAFVKLAGVAASQLINQPETILNVNVTKLPTSGASDDTSKEFTFHRQDQTTVPCLTSRLIVEDENQETLAVVNIYRDISVRVESERSLLKKAEELARARTELEQLELFAFVSTHDLQEPLHKIITFGNLMIADPDVVLSKNSESYRDKIIQATVELSQMISQLHDYSKILTAGEPFTSVNLNTVVNDVLAKLAPMIEKSKSQFHLDKLPIISGDQRQLYKLFLNLIKNAVTFHKEGNIPDISIQLTETENSVVISIKDNGIGMDAKFLPRLFKPFQRLHTTAEFPGRGLGLAICKRIVQRHKGEITAESELGKGSTFFLTFPK